MIDNSLFGDANNIFDMAEFLADSLIDEDELLEKRFGEYKFQPAKYIEEVLGWSPWRGQEGNPGQAEILDAYSLAIRQQLEKSAYDSGAISDENLKYWEPGQVIQNHIRVQAGHGVGKTKLAAGIVSHFFDCFRPGITYCFAPSYDQINDLLFKEIRVDRRNRNLPGHVLDRPELKFKENHFAKGRATNNAKTERVQGQHEEFMLFILDEAEGIADFVWEAVSSMSSGGVTIAIMLANPRTRISQFHKSARELNVKSFRMSCIYHPNVLEGYEVVPKAVKRDYVLSMVDRHCAKVNEHNEDLYTFELPWEKGVIYLPDDEFLFRVAGIPPISDIGNTFCPPGRYEAALFRKLEGNWKDEEVRIGVDCARYGSDYGSIFVYRAGEIYKLASIYKSDGYQYYLKVKNILNEYAENGVTKASVRVDGGGGYGSTIIDMLENSDEFYDKFEEFQVIEVHNNGKPYDEEEFADLVTEMYFTAAEMVNGISILDAPEQLQTDLCEREFKYVIRGGRDVKKLTSKEEFRRKFGRSPDDGDAFVLACAPERLFYYTDMKMGFA